MAAEQSAIYSKEGTATGSAVALETTHNGKYDHWQFYNTHASQDLVLTINGSNDITIDADSTQAVDITASPNDVTVKTNNTTYRILATGK